ncbi:hypothetical protein BH23ACT12_BH23ACT12_10130 [soil metagenome]
MRRRWPLGLAALLGVLLLGSMLVAVFKGVRVKGSVPGKGAILGLAAIGDGLVIGTADGVLTSADGSTWIVVDGFSGESLAASAGADVFVLSSGNLYRSSDLENFTESVPDLGGVTALTAGSEGTVYAARPAEVLTIPPGGPPSPRGFDRGPPEILALAVGEGASTGMLAGDLSSGLWQSEDSGFTWSRILETPIRAVLLDRAEPGRRFIGTAGGVLWSTVTQPWQFTDLRVPVEALAQTPDGYLAITGDRLLFESADGLTWKVRSPETD